MKTLMTLIFILTSVNSYAYSSRQKHTNCNCVTELLNTLEENTSSQNIDYKKHGSFVKLDNDAEFLEGTNKEEAIILVHGFIASPYEVRSVARELNDIGYTVYMPLLYGFGAYGEMANNGKLEIWKNQIKSAVTSLSGCYKKITLGGISLGAALATDYVMTTKDQKITSLVLLSPYYNISQSVAKTLIGPLAAVKDSTALSFLFTISKSEDLVEILKNGRYYSDIMPFKTLQELFKFSDEMMARGSSVKSDLPVFLAYSEFDSTISLETAVELPKKHFKNISTYKLTRDLRVPHQITYESSNPKFYDMIRKIIRFTSKANLLHKN